MIVLRRMVVLLCIRLHWRRGLFKIVVSIVEGMKHRGHGLLASVIILLVLHELGMPLLAVPVRNMN